MRDLAVIIVTYNVREIVLDAIRTLYDDLRSTSLDAEVIVVDSASQDDTVQAIRDTFPQVHVIASETNLGFAGGNNAGMRYLGIGDDDNIILPRAVYLLNPDTLTQQGATESLFDALFAADDIGVVGARLNYGDGTHQHSSFTFPGLRQLWVEFFPTPGRLIASRFNGRYPMDLYDGHEPFEVDFMLGATMMLRREVIQQVGMFDPEFFMYAEEVDWQWRIKDTGWRILCVPTARVTHLEGKSASQDNTRRILNLWESRLKLYKKHYSGWKLFIAKRMVIMGMARKIRQAQRNGISQNVIDAYSTVIEMAKA